MLCLIQCGQTVWNADGRIQGSADLPMSDGGRVDVQRNLHQLAAAKPTVIHHPADEAATETARLCAACTNAKLKAADELADPHLGLLEGLTEQEFSERFPTRFKQWEDDPVSVSPPEGEELIHAADRLFKAVAKILKRSRSDEVGVVLHEMGIGLLRCWLADRPLNDLRAMLKNRPRIERYAVPIELVGTLENAATPQFAQQS